MIDVIYADYHKLGDIVSSVNGQSLAGMTRQEASIIIKNSVDVVDLVVIRGKTTTQLPAKLVVIQVCSSIVSDDKVAREFRELCHKSLTSAVIEELVEDEVPHGESLISEFVNLPEGETFVVQVKRDAGSFGLRIAGGRGKPFGGGFIYVKSLVKDTPAEKCNKLKECDIILKVGESITRCQAQERARCSCNTILHVQ